MILRRILNFLLCPGPDWPIDQSNQDRSAAAFFTASAPPNILRSVVFPWNQKSLRILHNSNKLLRQSNTSILLSLRIIFKGSMVRALVAYIMVTYIKKCKSVFPSVRLSDRLSFHLHFCPSVRPSVLPPVHSSIRSSFHKSMFPSNHHTILPSVCSH